jgi:hypothetical protein
MVMHHYGVTTNLRIGCGFNIVPMWHPLRLAEDYSMTDILTSGRVIFGSAAATRLRGTGQHLGQAVRTCAAWPRSASVLPLQWNLGQRLPERSYPNATGLDDREIADPIFASGDQRGQPCSRLFRLWHGHP